MAQKPYPLPTLGGGGMPAAPHLYPRMLRRVADALDALNAIGDPDPRRQESPHWLGADPITVYDEEAEDTTDPTADIVGWLCLVDLNCWVFVPFLDSLALERLTSQPVRWARTTNAQAPKPKAVA